MRLSLEYLRERHETWRKRICEAGIWQANHFLPVELVIRKDCRSYHGMFQRRVKVRNGVKEIKDKIIIYNKAEDFDPHFLDSVLVHEMIHQYIFQAGLKDNRTHGKIFRLYMDLINRQFEGELKINISDRNPASVSKGPGEKVHHLLLIQHTDGNCFLAVIMPSKIATFDKLVRQNKKIWKVKSFLWAQSDDKYFNNFRRCMKSLHGIRKPLAEMKDLCREYNVKLSSQEG